MNALDLIPEVVVLKAIEEFKKRLIRTLGAELEKIVFFGSRAKGQFRADSDIDLLVVVREKTRPVVETVFSIVQQIETNILPDRYGLSVHLYEGQRYLAHKAMGSQFLKNIDSEGIVIYERTPES